MKINIFTYKNEADTDELIKKSVNSILPGCDVKISVDGNGKKHIKAFELGVTHSGGVTVIALADFPFGIDCESAERKIGNREGLIKKYFSIPEKNAIADDRDFLTVWTRKEAYVKYTGEGLKKIAAIDTFNVEGGFTTMFLEGCITTVYTPVKENFIVTVKNN